MEYVYPAIFFPDDDCVGVYFYDAENWLTFGRTFREAIANAEDVLAFALWSAEQDNDKIPPATPLKNIQLKENQSVMMIRASTKNYAAKNISVDEKSAAF